MRYEPTPIPQQLQAGLRVWLAGELRRLANAVGTAHAIRLEIRASEPERYTDGMVVYADGATWDPGSGEGFYGRENGAWVKL